MYTPREVLAYKGNLPAQQNPTGVTPQLLDLLAMQKVNADKKAAAQQMAIQAGQANMPTVAQGMEQQALNSARGEIAQKLGLAGLMQQQAPQMPPSQGIASAPSPLPESYQEGGIVAFAEAGQVPKADSEAETFVDSLGIERNAKTGDPVRSLLQRLGDFRDREQAKTAMPERRVINAADERMLRTAAPESIEERPYVERNLATRQPGVANLAGNITPQNSAPTPRVIPAGLADAAKADMSAVPGMGSKPSGAPVMSPENIAFIQAQKDRIGKEQNLDPETLAAAREARYDKRIGVNNLAAIENQKVRTAGLQALYDRQVEERPSSFITGLQRMGENVHALPGQQFQGVSSAITKAREGYTTQDIANKVSINTLTEAMEKAIRDNDIGGYNAAVAGLDEAKARILEGGKQGTTMADVLERTQSQKEVNYNTVEGRKATMAMRMRELTARAAEVAGARESTEKARAFEADQKQAMALAMSAATKMMELPQNMAKYKGMSVEEVALPLYQKFLTELTVKPGAPRAPAATPTQRTIDFRTGKPI